MANVGPPSPRIIKKPLLMMQLAAAVASASGHTLCLQWSANTTSFERALRVLQHVERIVDGLCDRSTSYDEPLSRVCALFPVNYLMGTSSNKEIESGEYRSLV